MVRKANGKWRMCVDFTDLNKACPKDHFPLPRIDQLVDSTAGCELLSVLDAYSGYHQISMAKEDEEKIAFITLFGNTFQRTVQGALNDQLGNNVEAYVDDIVVKAKTSDSLIDDLRETFDNLRRYRLMLNPEKCTFVVPSGKLLGFLVFGRGIEQNPEKIKAIENMKSPTRVKEVQKLTGCMVALSRSDGQTDSETWTMAFDGALNNQGAGVGFILTSPSGDQFKHAIHLDFRATNNTAEYEGLLAGIRAAAALGVKRLIVKGDSELFPNHRQNTPADIETTNDWRIPLIKFITSDELPEDDAEAEKITRQAKIYCMIGNDLYKKAPNGLLLKCVSSNDGKHLLLDIHERICGSHASGRTLVEKAFRQGFFWPTALKDACDMVQRCEACQFHSKNTKLPAQALQTIPLTWPFSCWGLDILGPFPRAQGGYRFLFVVIDKFTKWIEATPMGEIKADNAIKFIKGIFCRYGLPHRIITDNSSQFISADFQDYCIGLGVKICFASVSHPQSNGQVERANGIVLQGIKTRVYDKLMSHDRKWVEELPSVLWAVRTTPTTSNKETPFFLVYGSEAMLPTELRHQSTRVQKYSDEDQEEQRNDDVNLLEEHRERVVVRAASYQQALRRYHEKRIRARTLSISDYFLRRVQSQAWRNKLLPKWEGLYTITQVLRPGAFKIVDGDGRELANSWNIDQLRKFYV
uniref:OSJNBa0072D08.10 protein n=1 Tax=Oryza sativa subsp. japonica TaxID=39947 RepID=Q7XWQ1_ORYSJ|nr:OSJNBa0072D08.10 [Oryza sativa Japonica Group]